MRRRIANSPSMSEGEAERLRLVRAAAEYAVRTRRLETTLRPLAAALGRSPRTLLYHFGSKTRLDGAIAAEVFARERALFEQWIARTPEYELSPFLLATWRRFSAPRHEGFARLYLEHYARGRTGDDPELQRAARAWIEAFRDILERAHVESDRAEGLATLIHAVIRGLLLDILATGDRARADRAFRSFVNAIERPRGPDAEAATP